MTNAIHTDTTSHHEGPLNALDALREFKVCSLYSMEALNLSVASRTFKKDVWLTGKNTMRLKSIMQGAATNT